MPKSSLKLKDKTLRPGVSRDLLAFEHYSHVTVNIIFVASTFKKNMNKIN